MKALKYRSGKSGITSTAAVLAASVAASLATTTTGVNVALAQSGTDAAIDIEACQALSDSTALDRESIETRIACYSRDVEHLNQLVNQLMSERDELATGADTQNNTIEEYKQELAQRQDAMQRLEERAAQLSLQLDEVTTDRNRVREQLIELISENKDQPADVAANQIIFENFSQTYVSLTSEIEDLRNRLNEFEAANSDLNDQQLATQNEKLELQTQNEKLTAQITSLEETVATLATEKEELQASLTTATAEVDELNKQLLESAGIAEQRLVEITDLKTALDTSENQRKELEGTIASLNEKHLEELSGLTGQANALNSEIETLKAEQLALQEQSKLAADDAQAGISARDDELERLFTVRQELIAEREKLSAESQAGISARDEELQRLFSAQQELIAEREKLMAESQAGISARDEELDRLFSVRQELNVEREELIADIAALEKSHLQETDGYKKQAGELEEQIASITSDKSELESQLQEQIASNEKLKADAGISNGENTRLNLAATRLELELKAAGAQTEELQADIDKLGQQSADDKARLNEQVAELSSTIEQSQQERDELAAELDTVKPQLKTAEDNLRNSEEQNNTLAASVKALEQKLAQAAAQQENLKASLLDTESKSLEANENLASLKNNAETLTSLLSMSRAHSKNADATLKELQSEISDADIRLEEKQAELEALLAEKARIENDYKALANKARSQAQAIEDALLDAGHDTVKVAVSDDNAIGILLGSGQLFRTGSARLSEAGRLVLTDLAASMDPADDRRIMISGHSDNVPLGAVLVERYKDNWGLSMARALATANFLADEAGIPADRMSVSGFGATQPIADNETLEGRQQNRRVEISLIAADETVASAE